MASRKQFENRTTSWVALLLAVFMMLVGVAAPLIAEEMQFSLIGNEQPCCGAALTTPSLVAATENARKMRPVSNGIIISGFVLAISLMVISIVLYEQVSILKITNIIFGVLASSVVVFVTATLVKYICATDDYYAHRAKDLTYQGIYWEAFGKYGF